MATVLHKTGYHGPFVTVDALLKDLVGKLIDNNYFKQVFPTGGALAYDGKTTVILEPTNLVDSLRGDTNDKNTWRIAFTPDMTTEQITVNVATPVQLTNEGNIASGQGWTTEQVTLADGSKISRNPGEIKAFVDRKHLAVVPTDDFNLCAAYPMSYAFSISDHGLFLGIWDNGFDEYQNEFDNYSPAFRWLVIQRPVDNETGVPLVTGRAPVFCAYTVVDSGYVQPTADYIPEKQVGGVQKDPPALKYGDYYVIMRQATAQFHYKFVVCEADVYRPSLITLADVAQPDSNPIFNSNPQVAVSEDNKYVVTIPKGLNTTRYAYTHELDMMAYTSADVIGMFTDVDLPVYGATYKYKALIANRLKNTGMRILYRVE